ncbi:TPA: DUF1003 domain-containing protein [Enterococcus faecalis]|uniref:DUF1003 domain-containing protein n=1 Tax=Enterococcus faecalis TaxID=1351 RepID=UPI0001B2B817|nr:DUF1003 domain-containing protein [Enterococcus faecalis]HAP3746207.1 DUF1003 domain-containing protein [Enterococcus faecalis TDR28]HAP3752184.1 DUF1003 domain-containing protein [Enterococcus faecalis TDR22]HAP3754983.1 DUF1003 domain-containing protein [Enterococcus faecalis TDR13]HAP3758906.1 DUF1003 domain-containing protein [Enterococcus faecalis TDR7]HAP3769378.1 DUF1003 domain-containing protein [Enterococcus faecalis TDR19]
MKQSKNKQVVIGESTKKNIYLQDIEQETQAFILQNNPQLTAESMITLAELLNYRLDYMKQLVANDSEKIQQLNELVVQHIKEDKLISNNMNEKMEKKLTFGQRAADTIAKFGGSWVFIGFFCFVLIACIVINSTTLLGQPFDKYPYILLNLALSCLAAIQAPIIMMSQNRQEARDREQANNDYKINLKAEVEINLLHEKMDYIINNQLENLVKIQNIQIELLGELQEQLAATSEKE